MTDPNLGNQTLSALEACRVIALENIAFYKRVYDDIKKSPDRDAMGRAMGQKHSFVGSVEAILTNHGISFENTNALKPANDCNQTLRSPHSGRYLEREEAFKMSLENCLKVTNDELLIELLQDHLEAADIEMAAIKATSLKL